MGRTWLVLDMNNLAYRALYSTGELTHGGDATGVLYGILRDLGEYCERFGTHRLVFCFDHRRGLREQRFPWYKETRRTKVRPDIETEAIGDMKAQLDRLRQDYLADLGYPNVFFQAGYEADDLMAAVCHGLPDDDDAVLVSGDEDLFQLLRRRVCVYQPRPKRVVNNKSFRDQFGIPPRRWAEVKAIAGCKTDDVPGVRGVGETIAARFLKDGFVNRTDLDTKIRNWIARPQYQDNLEVVRLPYTGCRPIELADHGPPTERAWNELADRLGMTSLVDAMPGGFLSIARRR